jgi:hypothetical protein
VIKKKLEKKFNYGKGEGDFWIVILFFFIKRVRKILMVTMLLDDWRKYNIIWSIWYSNIKYRTTEFKYCNTRLLYCLFNWISVSRTGFFLNLILGYFRPKTSNTNNKDDESICVFRRYSDFETLRNYLVAKYSWVIVPVLPEKTVQTKRNESCLINFCSYRFHIHGQNHIKIEQVSKL